MRLMLLLLVVSSNALVAQEPATLVTFGDSTTATRGDLKVYAGSLQRELPERGLPIHVVNAGMAGHNTDHARDRFESDVLAHNPEIVVIQFGINDAAIDVWKYPPATESRVSLEPYMENLRYFVRTLKTRNVHAYRKWPSRATFLAQRSIINAEPSIGVY